MSGSVVETNFRCFCQVSVPEPCPDPCNGSDEKLCPDFERCIKNRTVRFLGGECSNFQCEKLCSYRTQLTTRLCVTAMEPAGTRSIADDRTNAGMEYRGIDMANNGRTLIHSAAVSVVRDSGTAKVATTTVAPRSTTVVGTVAEVLAAATHKPSDVGNTTRKTATVAPAPRKNTVPRKNPRVMMSRRRNH